MGTVRPSDKIDAFHPVGDEIQKGDRDFSLNHGLTLFPSVKSFSGKGGKGFFHYPLCCLHLVAIVA